MAESTNIFKAVVQQWRNSAALTTIPIRSTRVPAGQTVTTPYAILLCKTVRRLFFSGNSRCTYYRITIMAYTGQKKSDQVAIQDAVEALFDRNIGLPVLDDCYVMSVTSEADDPDVDPADYFGGDVNVLSQSYKVLLNERINPVQSVQT